MRRSAPSTLRTVRMCSGVSGYCRSVPEAPWFTCVPRLWLWCVFHRGELGGWAVITLRPNCRSPRFGHGPWILESTDQHTPTTEITLTVSNSMYRQAKSPRLGHGPWIPRSSASLCVLVLGTGRQMHRLCVLVLG